MQRRHQEGFSLLELAIVFVIVSVVAGSGFIMLRQSWNQWRRATTQQYLEEAKTALLLHARTQGALPLPQTVAGVASTWLPDGVLKVKATDAYGNRLQYVVNPALTADRTASCNALSELFDHTLDPTTWTPKLWQASMDPGAHLPVAAVILSAARRLNPTTDPLLQGTSLDSFEYVEAGVRDNKRAALDNCSFVHTPEIDGVIDDLIIAVAPHELYEQLGCAAAGNPYRSF